MGFLKKLLGTDAHSPKPYVDAGVQLTRKLVQTLGLDGWQGGLPNYTSEETNAIERELSQFQRTADDVAGGATRFHPDIVKPLQRMKIAEALQDFAMHNEHFSDESDDESERPINWKALVSTYLKAWACALNPRTLIMMSDLLAKSGYRTEAKETLRVVLLFPTYAHVLYGGASQTNEIVSIIVGDAEDSLKRLGE